MEGTVSLVTYKKRDSAELEMVVKWTGWKKIKHATFKFKVIITW